MGVVGAIGAEMIATGVVKEVGVVPPERCIPAGPFRTALARRQIETAIVPPDAPLGAPRSG